MKTPAVIPAIAERKHRTAEQIQHANEHVLRTLHTVIENAPAKKSGASSKVQDRRERRGIPYVGTGGIDTRRDPLIEVLDREHQRERAARIRSKRKAAGRNVNQTGHA